MSQCVIMLAFQECAHTNTATHLEGLPMLVIAGRATGSQGSSFFLQLSSKCTLPGMLITVFPNLHQILQWKGIFNVCFFSLNWTAQRLAYHFHAQTWKAALSFLRLFFREKHWQKLALTNSHILFFSNKRTFNVYFIFWVLSFWWWRRYWRLPMPSENILGMVVNNTGMPFLK